MTEDYRNAAEDGISYDQPDWVNNLVCEPPCCPLKDEEVEHLIGHLCAVVDVESREENARREVWVKAFESHSQHEWGLGERLAVKGVCLRFGDVSFKPLGSVGDGTSRFDRVAATLVLDRPGIGWGGTESER